MMSQRSITIVGAGQSGLQLAIGLLDRGYEVRVVSDRTADEIGDGRVSSSQCMFDTALDHENPARKTGYATALAPPPRP